MTYAWRRMARTGSRYDVAISGPSKTTRAVSVRLNPVNASSISGSRVTLSIVTPHQGAGMSGRRATGAAACAAVARTRRRDAADIGWYCSPHARRAAFAGHVAGGPHRVGPRTGPEPGD